MVKYTRCLVGNMRFGVKGQTVHLGTYLTIT